MGDARLADAGTGQDRRDSRRFPCDHGIAIEWGSAVLQGRVSDISADGMFVMLENPLWVGASFAAELGLDSPVRVECTVRRVEPMRGMALTYSVVEDSDRAALDKALTRLSRQ